MSPPALNVVVGHRLWDPRSMTSIYGALSPLMEFLLFCANSDGGRLRIRISPRYAGFDWRFGGSLQNIHSPSAGTSNLRIPVR